MKQWKVFSMGERIKGKHQFSGTKVFEAMEVRKYFINAKIENEVFG